MTLRELEKILMNISMDASTVGNAQYSMIIGATLNMLKSVENLSTSVHTSPFNDSCKGMMMQKMAELDTFTTQSILMRIAEMGIDISFYSTYNDNGGRVPVQQQPEFRPVVAPMMMQQPMMMQPMMQHQPMMQQPMMQPMHQPVAMPAHAPAPMAPPPPPPQAAPTPTAAPQPTPPPPMMEPEPVMASPAPASSGGGGISLGGALPGMGGGPVGEGPAYLLKVINGEI